MQIKTPCCKLYLQQGAEKQIEQLSVSFIRTIPSAAGFHRISVSARRLLLPVRDFTLPRRYSVFVSAYRVYSFGGLPEKSAITACAPLR